MASWLDLGLKDLASEFLSAVLDSERKALDFKKKMMRRYLFVIPLLVVCNCVLAQADQPKDEENPTTDPTVKVAAETIASCQQATQELGNHVLRGNFLFTKEKMYPRYMKRQIALHGEDEFNKQFESIAKRLIEMGVTINSFTAEQPVGFFRVWPQIKPDAKRKLDSGQQKDLLDGDVVYNLLIMVPTIQVWTFTNNRGEPPRKLKREGFLVAIAQEVEVPGTEDWTFIDGATIQPQELRAMFPSLPQKLVLPMRLDSEIK